MSIYTIYNFFLSFVHYVFMYKMYDVRVYIYLFLFCIHVVVGVDDFSCFVIFPQSNNKARKIISLHRCPGSL
jgi:hypothetical protein